MGLKSKTENAKQKQIIAAALREFTICGVQEKKMTRIN